MTTPNIIGLLLRKLKDINQFLTLDPLYLLTMISQLQDQLWPYAYLKPEGMRPPLSPATSLPLPSQPEVATNGQSTHHPPGLSLKDHGPNEPAKAPDSQGQPATRTYRRSKPTRRLMQAKRWWRTRADPFAEVWPEVTHQLEQQPYLEANVLFAAVQKQYPGKFPDQQLRTFQRRVKTWRVMMSSRKIELDQENKLPSLKAPISHLGKILE